MVVYLVGAGPGDPDLITLKAVKILKDADVVIYDRLANDRILEHAENADLIYVGKKAGEHYKSQDEINQILIKEAEKHDHVVRLKGGDPFVFGRGGEEMLGLLEKGIPVKLVPGVTSAVGAPTSIGLPVTHRSVATSLTIVTGHEDPTKSEKQVKWDFKADTIIILMGIGNLEDNTRELMKYRDPQTPVCVIENGTLPEQRIITGTLEDISKKDINPPALVIVGKVVDVFRKAQSNDFKGKIIAITRPLERSQEAVRIIEDYGGAALVAPTLELQVSNTQSLIKLCQNAGKLDWLIFTSPTSILSLFKHCTDLKERLNPQCKIAVIGPRTGKYLEEYDLKPDVIPDDYTAEGLLEVFKDINIRDKNIGLPRTLAARDVLPEGLRDRGAHVFLAEAYKSTFPKDRTKVNELIKRIIKKEVDAVTFTSTLTVSNLFEMVKEEDRKGFLEPLKNGEVLVAAIGPVTAKPLEEQEIPTIIPEKYTVKAMLDKLKDEINR